MTEEQRKQVINALAEWIIDMCENGSTNDANIQILPEMVRALTELSKSGQ